MHMEELFRYWFACVKSFRGCACTKSGLNSHPKKHKVRPLRGADQAQITPALSSSYSAKLLTSLVQGARHIPTINVDPLRKPSEGDALRSLSSTIWPWY